MLILGIIIIIVSLYLLYLKYRVVFTGEKCKGKIIGIVDQNAGYTVGGKRKIGKEIFVFKNEKYGKEVFKCFDFRIEIVTFLTFLSGVFLIYESLQ